ncbi:MAG: DNA polymerase III subunit alpha [Moraxella sp.]|uniref:DNA polymerase III subunit alpha n=1 Tax=Moraxella sp. TaxID=479 RepID=UPI0026DD795D|nr:DNA polymerase III subunit alpha [Moraxella sp.]MDO4449858.1 DNA polymerase III subunit alpha [Moraxella sp.]
MAFVHLGVHTEYAILDSIVKIKELVKAAAADGQTALGIADFNTFALVKFYKACLGAGIKPLLGTEVIIGDEFNASAEHERFSVILYAMNNNGYQNILRLVSDSYTNRPMGADGKVTISTPIVLKSELFDPTKNADIIAILTHRSEITSALHGGMNTIGTWKEAFGDRLYLAIKRTHIDDDDFNKDMIVAGAKWEVPIIAHNDVRFMNATPKIQGKEDATSSDFEAHEARVCIAGGYVLADNTRPRIYSELQYFKTQQEMEQLFADLPQAIENTRLLASRCNVTLTLGKNFLPAFPIPEGMTEEEFFRKTAKDGLDRRLDKLYPPQERDETWTDVRKPYDDRLEFELGIILKMGFPGYFLIVMDFIRWAKENGVPVGPGRGSGAGSLVAYSLNITDLDPLRYDLLFERFLNPERVSMPDFDVDFCIEGRDRVIQYVADTYGRMAVSQIITFGTMAARAVVRDVARVQGKSYGLADKISKLIPKTPSISLSEAIEEEPLLKDLLTNPDAQDHEQAVEIWEMAEKLEGITRNVGKHAGGVLIAPNRISDFSAVYCDDEGHFVSQYDKDDVEAVGLVKFDFLGLRNLTVIKSAINNIDARLAKEGKPPIDLDTLPLDDMDVYTHVLQNGNTTAVFQLESMGMKKYLRQLKPSNIEDVIAMCALYRPGPLETGMVSDFIDRKHGIQEVAYPDPQYQHEWLKSALEPTYGVIVYQEQVMQIAQTLAGYTLGGADMLRRAMGKKKPEEMAAQRSVFEKGAINLGVDGELAIKIFELVEKFAGYGFNKSHSAAYGVLAYQTAYLKHYYPAEFMAAVLTSEMDDTDTVVFLISDCKDNFQLEVLPPSVNHSQFHFVAKDPKTIIYGLGAVKGVGEDAVASIVRARNESPFKDLYDFCNRVDTKKVGKRALEALINAGCFDDLASVLRPELTDVHGKNRSYEIRGGLWEQLPQAMEVAHQNRQNSEAGTFDLFAEVDEGLSVAPPLPDIIWGDQTRLRGEKDTLGLYLTGHPMDAYRDELSHYTNVKSLSDMSETGYGKFATVAGVVVDVANFGNRIAITLDDGSCRTEISCYTDKYFKLQSLLEGNISLNAELTQKYAHITKTDKNFNPKKLNSQSLAKVDKKDWEQITNLNGMILIARVSVSENDGRIFARLQGGRNLIECRLKYLTGLHIKLHSHDTKRLDVLIGALKENCTPNPDEIANFIKNETTTEDGNAIIDTSGNAPDGCLPTYLYLYDECGLCQVMVNDRFRIYPSDGNLNQLKQTFGENLIIR